MIRSNLFIRRFASTIASKHRIAATSAVDTLVVGGASSSTPPPSIHFSTSFASTTPRRQFSSSSDAATELGSILQREINEEIEAAAEQNAGSGQPPPELAELQSDISAKWTILEGISGIGGSGETGSGATVRLFRKEAGSKGAKIGIVFHCQDTEEDANFDDDDEDELFEDQSQDEGEEEKEEEEEPEQAVRFGVTVSKGGKTVVLQCRAGFDVSVESVMVRDGDTESVLAELAGGEGLQAALYQVSFFAICG